MQSLSDLGGLSVTTARPLKLSREPVGLTLLSDLHIGASNVDHARIKRDIQTAVKRRDRILINGDIFDAIIAGDKRHTQTVLHPKLRNTDFPMDVAVEWAAEMLAPAAHAGLLDYMGHGNHETAIQARSGTNLIADLRLRLEMIGTAPPPSGYAGFICYPWKCGTKASGEVVIFAHHGSKSGTGATFLARMGTFIDADVLWCGHFHQKQSGGLLRVGPGDGDTIRVREQRRVMTGGYSFAYGANPRGQVEDRYASVAALPPGLMGAARLMLSHVHGGLCLEVCN